MMPPKTSAEPTPEAGAAPGPDATEALTLEQWATARSARDRRVEMLNAFASTERAAGRFSNTEAGWNAAYIAFANRPI